MANTDYGGIVGSGPCRRHYFSSYIFSAAKANYKDIEGFKIVSETITLQPQVVVQLVVCCLY